MTTTATMRTMNDPTPGNWDWQPQPAARALVEERLVAFLGKCPEAARFGEQLLADTGTHITDWVGVILTPDTPETRERLEAAGYVPRTTEFVDADIHYAFWNPGASTPDILLTEADRMSVGLLIDSVADFFAANQLSGVDHIQGEPHARARWAQVAQGDGAALWVFERHGYNGFHLKFEIAEHRIAAAHHLERLRARARRGDQARALEQVERAVRAAADELGPDWAADLFMQAEREFFLRNHCAAKAQCARQAMLGMGMPNIDHLVYACATPHLAGVLELFATLGFERRESFAVGAADTATVLEQPVTGHVVAIVSPAGDAPGSAGSWARLVGEGLLASGPAGLALRGEHDTLVNLIGLPADGNGTVASIPVSGERLETAARDGLIDDGIAHTLRNGGVIGPVLSLVSRRDGSRVLTPDTLAWRIPGQA
jgi:hypothetical protein